MNVTWTQIKKYGLLAITLPLISGCGGGGFAGLGGAVSLFAGLAGGGGGAGTGGGAVGGSGLLGGATIINPEPASMFLMGSGIAAMAYFKSRKKS